MDYSKNFNSYVQNSINKLFYKSGKKYISYVILFKLLFS